MATGEILIKVNDISLFDEIKEAISRVRGIVSVSLTKKDTKDIKLKRNKTISPEVASLMQLIEQVEPLPADYDYREEYTNYLIEKYK